MGRVEVEVAEICTIFVVATGPAAERRPFARSRYRVTVVSGQTVVRIDVAAAIRVFGAAVVNGAARDALVLAGRGVEEAGRSRIAAIRVPEALARLSLGNGLEAVALAVEEELLDDARVDRLSAGRRRAGNEQRELGERRGHADLRPREGPRGCIGRSVERDQVEVAARDVRVLVAGADTVELEERLFPGLAEEQHRDLQLALDPSAQDVAHLDRETGLVAKIRDEALRGNQVH